MDKQRVVRNGSFLDNDPRFVRSADRGKLDFTNKAYTLGFRIHVKSRTKRRMVYTCNTNI